MTTYREEALREKAIALANNVINVTMNMSKYGKMPRKKARFYNKQRLTKRQKALVFSKMLIYMMMGAAQQSMIMSRPIQKDNPRFSSGGNVWIEESGPVDLEYFTKIKNRLNKTDE